MKRMHLYALILVLGASSCKLDWTCTCTYTDPRGPNSSHLVIMDSKGKDAKRDCDSIEHKFSLQPAMYQAVSCDLKKNGLGF